MFNVLLVVGFGAAVVGFILGWSIRSEVEASPLPRKPVLALFLICFGMGVVAAAALMGGAGGG